MDDPAESEAALNRFQILALMMLALLNMQDGFDILAISFAANALVEDWQLSNSALGFVLSASLFGMMIGAITLSLLADRLGRKPVAIIGLGFSGLGMLISAAAPGIEVMVAGRILTGVGVGGILVSLNTMVAELAGERYRGAAVAAFQVGFPIGAFLSGFAAPALIDLGGWRWVFLFGACTSFGFIPVMLWLPESAEFLAHSERADALLKVNEVRARMSLPPLTALPAKSRAPHASAIAQLVTLFSKRYLLHTALIWQAFFFLLMLLYFIVSWAPRLLVELGYDASTGDFAGRLINLAGLPGIALIGALGLVFRPSLITACYLLCAIGLLLVLASATLNLTTILAWFAAIGFVLHGGMIGLYSTAPALYPAEIRATGMGWAIGLSRAGAVLGPASAGLLLDVGFTVQALFAWFALAAGVAGLAALFLFILETKQTGSGFQTSLTIRL